MGSLEEPILDDSPFHIGDWTAEPATGFLRREATTRRLEPRVMSLLALLASRPGRVFSKDEILQRVWSRTFVEDSTLTRCVSDLRRALEDDARSPRYIQTLPKKGYRCIADVRNLPIRPLPGPESPGLHLPEPGTPPKASDSPGVERPAPTPRRRRSGRAVAGIVLLTGAVSLAGWVVLQRGWGIGGRWEGAVEAAPGTEDAALSAYDYYLEGRDHYKRYRKSDNQRAIELFRQALELDPEFALAQAELANALAVQKGNFHLPGDWIQQAQTAAHRSLDLQPDLPEGHKAMGHVLSLKSELRASEEHYRRALELRPDYREVIHNLSLVLHIQGRHDEAFEGFRKYHESGEPSADSAQHVGWIHRHLDLPEEAEASFRRSLQIEPYHIGSHRGLALLERQAGDFEAARRRLATLREVHPRCGACVVEAGDLELFANRPAAAAELYRDVLESAGVSDPYAMLRLGQALRRLRDGDAEGWIREAKKQALLYLEGDGRDPWPFWIAAAATALDGPSQEALSRLRTAVDAGWRRWDLDDAIFADLRGDPAYRALLQENRDTLEGMRLRITSDGAPKDDPPSSAR